MSYRLLRMLSSCSLIRCRDSRTRIERSTLAVSLFSCFAAPSNVSPSVFTRKCILLNISTSSAMKSLLPLALRFGLMNLGNVSDQNLTRDTFSPRISATSPIL